MRFVDPIELIYKSDENRYYESGLKQRDDLNGNQLISRSVQQQKNRTVQEQF